MSRHHPPVVLLVEDSDDDAFFFQRALKKTGGDVSLFHVSDGAAALRYLEAAHAGVDNAAQPWPDLVFLDLKLPALSGFEVLGHVREHAAWPQLDVTILSGSEHASDIERAMALGATDYLVKPISVEQLRSRLQGWAEKHAPRTVGRSASV